MYVTTWFTVGYIFIFNSP